MPALLDDRGTKNWTGQRLFLKRSTSTSAEDMKLQIVVLLLLLTCTCLSMAQGSYGNCCLGYAKRIKSSTKKNIQSYRMQETDGDCNITAVVFLMKKKPTESNPKSICTNPKDNWVQNLMRALDEKNQIIN